MFQSRVVFKLFSKQEIVTFPKLESFIHKNLRDEEVNDFWVHSRKNHSCSGKISSMHTNVMNTSWILQLRIINTAWLLQTGHSRKIHTAEKRKYFCEKISGHCIGRLHNDISKSYTKGSKHF